jgi:hypothetical protein
MSPRPTAEYDEVLARARAWPPEQRLRLVEDLLHSLPHARDAAGLRGVPVEKVRGAAAGAGPPPDDDAVRRWVEEHRAGRHG